MSAFEFIGRASAALFVVVATLIFVAIAAIVEVAPVVFAFLIAMLIARWWGLL